MKRVVILQRAEYEEILRRFDKIATLHKQLLFALQMRNPRPFSSTTKPETQYEEIVSRLDKISNLQKQLLAALKKRDPRIFPSTTTPENANQ